jgi:hypothetical protein
MRFDLARDITLPAAIDAADADEQATILRHFGAPFDNSTNYFVDPGHASTPKMKRAVDFADTAFL